MYHHHAVYHSPENHRLVVSVRFLFHMVVESNDFPVIPLKCRPSCIDCLGSEFWGTLIRSFCTCRCVRGELYTRRKIFPKGVFDSTLYSAPFNVVYVMEDERAKLGPPPPPVRTRSTSTFLLLCVSVCARLRTRTAFSPEKQRLQSVILRCRRTSMRWCFGYLTCGVFTHSLERSSVEHDTYLARWP